MGMKVVTDGMKEFTKLLKTVEKSVVLVGIPAEAGQIDARGPGGIPITYAEVGYILDHGSPAANIPARPFLVPGIRDAQNEIAKRLEAAYRAATIDRDPRKVQANLMAAGLAGQLGVQNKMNEGPFSPLAAATIYNRLHRKNAPRNSDKPLIDTGKLRGSVTYVVKPPRGY
jgi:hypothetical protein